VILGSFFKGFSVVLQDALLYELSEFLCRKPFFILRRGLIYHIGNRPLNTLPGLRIIFIHRAALSEELRRLYKGLQLRGQLVIVLLRGLCGEGISPARVICNFRIRHKRLSVHL